MALLPTETWATARTALARAVGALEATGTVTSGGGATGFTSTDLATYISTNRLKGVQAAFKTGTAIGQARLITTSTTAGAIVTVGPDFSPTPATADTFDLYRVQVADKGLLELALKYAIEVAQEWHMLPWEDVASIVLGSITQNGGFEDWTSGTAVAPDGWTKVEAGSAVARESTIILPPFRYSCKFQNAGSAVGTLRQQNSQLVYPWDFLASEQVKASALVYTTTASRVTLRWADDGSTYHSSTAHGGTGWELLSISAAAIAASPTELTFEMRISTGAQVTVYLHDFRIIPTQTTIYEYYLPKKFIRLGRAVREEDDFEWMVEIPQQAYDADQSRERLVFKPALWTPPGNYRVRLVGQTYQSVPSADGDAIELPLAYLVAMGRLFLAQMGRLPGVTMPQVYAEAIRLRRQLHRQPMTGSRRVR